MSTADFSSKTVKQNMTRSTGKLNLRTAEQERVRLTAAQQKQIQRLYENAAKEVAKQAEQAPRVPSDALRKQYLNQLQNQLNEELDKIRAEVESTVKDNMKKTAEAVVGDNIDFLKEVGMPVQGAFSHVPDEVVRAVATGQIYEGKWSLSRAIWKNTRRTQKDVQSVIAQGIAKNKSAYDIAKDLEKYVDPSAKKDWDWSKVYPGTAKKVDYSAQRLARTMVSHAYQQSFVRTTQKNPFVTKYKWVSSGGARMCEICSARDGVEYSKTDLPLDHPNGMCTFIAVIEDSMTDIADRIADWANGGNDPEIDTWAENTYGKNWGSKKDQVNPVEDNNVYHKVTSKEDEKMLYEGRANLSAEQQRYLLEYTVMSGTPNSYLRMPERLAPLKDLDPIKNGIPAIDKAIAESVLKENIAVYRTVDSAFLPAELSPGKIISDKAYNSTSISQEVVQKLTDQWNSVSRVTLEILVPAGKGQGIYIADIAADETQKEFLIKRYAKYKVTKILPDGTVQVKLL